MSFLSELMYIAGSCALIVTGNQGRRSAFSIRYRINVFAATDNAFFSLVMILIRLMIIGSTGNMAMS